MAKPASTRTRLFEVGTPSGKEVVAYPNYGVKIENTIEKRGFGIQTTESEGHSFPPPKGFRGDIGGPFRTTKSYPKEPWFAPGVSGMFDGFMSISFQGDMYITLPHPDNRDFPYPPTLESSNSDLEALGATAISRCQPTNSVADLSTFLGETVRDGLPHLVGSLLWESKTKDALRAGSGEYLNAQFGWVPLVSDIRKFADAVLSAGTVCSQYQRDAGKIVRRGYSFPSNIEFPISNTVFLLDQIAQGVISAGSVDYSNRGTIWRHRKVERRQWFKGSFTYALPTGNDTWSNMLRYSALADKLFGTSLTPEVLWNLAPWSWAADWFANIGDVLSNVSAFAQNGLVMPYGYVMEHTTVTDTYQLDKSGLKGSGPPTPLKLVTETKKRVQANPFGFGVKWEGLSPFQISILAALGIQRRR